MAYKKGTDMKEISIRIFGTEDYKKMLEILPPYDGMVRAFKKEVARLPKEERDKVWLQ